MSEQASDFLSRAQEGMGSRFQSQASIDESNTRREKEWKEAYARLGQEPPKPTEFTHDGLTLFERLELNKRLNTEEWDDKMKLANQYRGINADEKRFLDERHAEKMAAQKKIDDEVNMEMQAYREALAAKKNAGYDDSEAGPSRLPPTNPASIHTTSSTSSPIPSKPASSGPSSSSSPAPNRAGPLKPVKNDVKSLLKGVIVKKKPKIDNTSSNSATGSGSGGSGSASPVPEGYKGRIGPTAAEVRATEKVGAAGMTALGKRLVQEEDEADPSDLGDKRARVES